MSEYKAFFGIRVRESVEVPDGCFIMQTGNSAVALHNGTILDVTELAKEVARRIALEITPND